MVCESDNAFQRRRKEGRGEEKGMGMEKGGRGEEKEGRVVGKGRREGNGTESNLHHQIQKTWLNCRQYHLNALHFELQYLYRAAVLNE